MNRNAGVSRPGFTARQRKHLAFIHAYTLVNGRPPTQADMVRFFRVTPPIHIQPVKISVARYLRGQQPFSRQTVVELIASATHYPRAFKVSREEMKTLNITGDEFHPEWNNASQRGCQPESF